MKHLSSLPTDTKKRLRECHGYLMALSGFFRRRKKEFVIVSGGRRGSHLLIDLLNSQSELHADGELLHLNAVQPMVAPRLYLRGHEAWHKERHYGWKVSVNQLRYQNMSPADFLGSVVRRGGSIIHLVRENLLRVVVSREIAQIRGRHQEHTPHPLRGQTFLLDKLAIVDGIQSSHTNLQEEFAMMEHLPHLRVTYESDLLDPQCHQSTCDRVFQFVGSPRWDVSTSHARRSPNDLREIIENYDEVASAVRNAGFSNYLYDARYADSHEKICA